MNQKSIFLGVAIFVELAILYSSTLFFTPTITTSTTFLPALVGALGLFGISKLPVRFLYKIVFSILFSIVAIYFSFAVGFDGAANYACEFEHQCYRGDLRL